MLELGCGFLVDCGERPPSISPSGLARRSAPEILKPIRPGGRLQRSYVRVARQAGLALAVSASTVLRMIHAGIPPANQLCKGAPWIIRHCDLERDDVRRDAMARRARHPVSCDPLQQTLDL